MVVGFDVRMRELVLGGADAPEYLDQQNDDVGESLCSTAPSWPPLP